MSAVYSLHYNSPALIGASLVVFLWAKGMKIQSKRINWVASSVFAVYLVHCNAKVIPLFNQVLWNMKAVSESQAMTAVLIGGFLVAVFVGCILIDKVRMEVFGLLESVWRHRK